jgi:hypothetical protein
MNYFNNYLNCSIFVRMPLVNRFAVYVAVSVIQWFNP